MDGYDDIVKAFNDLGNEDLIFKLSEPSIKCAEIIAEKARSKIHFVTGDLELSINVVPPGRKRGKAYQISARVEASQGKMTGSGLNGYYAAAVELGHRAVVYGKLSDERVTARPFMRPAADESKAEVEAIMADAMMEIIKEEWSR